MTRILIIFVTLILTACASVDKDPGYSLSEVELEDDSIDESIIVAQKKAIDRIYAQIDSDEPVVETESTKPVGAKEVEIQYVLQTKEDHPKVQKWIEYYSIKDRERFQRFLNRGAKYKQVVQDLLISNGLPPDLYYLGILESGYVTEAVSHAGAVGPWQFMAPTGRQYGLKINNYVDERLDPIRSTLAAVRYLKELYRQKKSWYLALAAYNAGPGRVKRAMRRGGVRNYWTLTKRRLLPYDTREYIPQFLAILTIGKDLEKYKFVERAEEHLQPMELVKVPSPVKFDKISEVTGLDKSTLQAFNSHLKMKMTPPGKKKHYHLWIPKNHIEKVGASYAMMEPHRIKGLKVQRFVAGHRRYRYHRVRRGQNLSTIARRYGTSVSKIKRLNGMRRSRIYVGQKLKVRGSTRKSRSVASTSRNATFHRVRRGENLTMISKRYGVSVGRLKTYNGLKSGKIFVGQKLKLQKRKYLKVATKKKVKRYRIRSGDNLYKIARKFGTTVKRIKRINNLSSNRIMRGQYLKIAAN